MLERLIRDDSPLGGFAGRHHDLTYDHAPVQLIHRARPSDGMRATGIELRIEFRITQFANARNVAKARPRRAGRLLAGRLRGG
jgi:hypothetical protein